MDQLRHLPDNRVYEILKAYWKVNDFTFYGEFVPEKNEEGRRSGIIRNIKSHNSNLVLKYPGKGGYVTFIIPYNQKYKDLPRGYYKFQCHLLPLSIRSKKNYGGILQPLLSTLEPISDEIDLRKSTTFTHKNFTKSSNRKDDRISKLEDNNFGWGKPVNHLFGAYTEEDGEYYLTDIRNFFFAKVRVYPKTTFKVGPLKLSQPIPNVEQGQFCSFNWKFTDKNRANPLEIEIDEDKTIIPISSKELIDKLYYDSVNNQSREKDQLGNSIDTITRQIAGQDPCTFIYELLQNASDYPYDETVDVEIHLTKHYFIFRHTGEAFNGQNVLGICGVNEGEKSNKKETIGYKGIGFKNVFIDNGYVYISSNDFSFCFDERATGRNYITTPKWVEASSLDPKVREILAKDASRFRVNIVLRPRRESILFDIEDSYKDRLHEVFDDIRKIVFISHINKVSVFIEGEQPFVCSRNTENNGWLISKDYSEPIKSEIREKLKEEIINKTGRAPEKFLTKKYTSVAFACPIKENDIIAENGACIYCYLPTKVKWGFPFLINTDMIPTGPRDSIETGEFWNYEFAEIAGRQFFNWIKDLVNEHKFTYNTIFSLIPNFSDCITKHEEYKGFIERFQKGFEEKFLKEPIFPTEEGSIVTINELIYDKLFLSQNEAVFTDKFFYEISDLNGYFLPAKELRCGSFNLLMKRYENNIHAVITEDNLNLMVEKSAFQKWIVDQDNNKKFLRFLIGKNLILNFKDKKIFLSEDGNVTSASALYYNVDEEANALPFFNKYLPRLSTESRKFLESFTSNWNDKGISMFTPFSVNFFVQNILLSSENATEVTGKLSIEENSLSFFNFLALKEVINIPELMALPLFDAGDKLISNFNYGLIFFESEEGEIVKNASWMNSNWINFVSPKYSDAAKKYMMNHLGVRDYNSKIIANEIILGEKYNKVISAKIQESFATNKDFVTFCYSHHTEYLDGSLNGYPLYVENFKTENAYQILEGISPKVEAEINASHPATWSNHYVLTEDHVYFMNALFEDMFSKEWLDKEWMFCLSEKYFVGINTDEQTAFKLFLNKKFGVKEFTNNIFVDEIVLPNIKSIIENISKNKEDNYDFVRFLDDNFKHIFEDNRNNITKFSVFPVVDNNGDIVIVKPSVQKIDTSNDGVNTFYRTYLYDSKLENILSLSWMQNNPVFMANKTYGNSKALEVIGLKAFDFTDFFNGVIGSSNITYIISTLKDFETNKEFHDFLKENVSDLKQFAIIRANVPVYLLGHTNPAITCSEHKILSPAAKDLFALGLVEPKDLDIIDPRYNPEQDFNYWTNEDRLNNKQFTTNHFVSWLKSNVNTFAQKLQTKEANIKFWRWAKRNLKDSVKSFQTLPVITKQGTILSLDNTIYLSDTYMGDSGYENLVLSFDGKANIISKEYVQHGDDIKEWLDFWTKLNVRSNEVDILRDTVLPKISEFKVDGLLKRFALHRNELEKNVPNFLSKLSNINLKTEAGLFLPAKDVIYIDCEKTEPFQMVKLENTVSFTTADEKVLIGQIIDLHVGRRVTSLTEWRSLKINTYIKKQNADIDSIKSYHYAFINELCSLYDKDYSYISSIDKEIKEIKLHVKDGCFLLGKEITIGTAYKPFCDFEANNIPYRYLSERYLSECTNKPQVTLRVMFGLHSNLEDSDLHLMEESRSFALYIWQNYLTGNSSYSANNISKLKRLIEQHKLNDLECIPTKSGLKSPKKLYSRRIYAYVSKLKNYEELTPYKEIQNIQYSKDQKDKYLFDLLPFKTQLNFNDCVYDLFYFKKPDDRKQLLSWMLNQYVAEEDANIIDSYRDDQNALWQNAKLKPVPISKLYALNPSSQKLSQFFGTNEHIINSAYFPVEDDKFNQTCQMLGVIVINESDVIINPQVIPNGDYTEWNLFFEEVSLLMSGIESELNWKEKFNAYKLKVNKIKMIQCSSISMSYSKDKDVSQNKKKFYHPESDSERFYYVDDFRNAKVFIDFVESFKEYMGTDLDKDLLSDILFAKKSDLRDMFSEQTRLLEDDDFRNTLSNYFPEFLKQEDEKDDSVEELEGPCTFGTYGIPDESNEDSEDDTIDDVSDDVITALYGNQDPLNASSTSKEQSSKTQPRSVDSSSAQERHSGQQKEKVSDSRDGGNYVKPSSSNTLNGEKKSADTPNSGSKSGRRSNGKSHYEPKPYTAAQVSAWKSKGQPLELSEKEATEDERGDINSLLGENMTAEQVADANYLAQLRLYNSLKDRGDISEEKDDKASFIKNGSKEEEIHLSSGKWIHKCSAAHGILYISPKVWNMVSNDKYIVCVYLGAKQNEFMYLNSKDDILKLISNDDIIIKMTGKERVRAVDELYDHVLSDVTGTAYTMIRVASNEEYNSFFEPITNSGTDNEDDL